jgi:predicted nucleic acid-binding protein
MSDKIFVDTSAWIGLFNPGDKYHRDSLLYWEQLKKERFYLVTNDYILDETYTLLRRTLDGLAKAMAAREVIEKSRLVDVVEVNEDYRQRGWEIFRRYDDKVLSFTDCVAFAMMHYLGLYQVFSFDNDFARAGFIVRP